jgi:hypothetical protein
MSARARLGAAVLALGALSLPAPGVAQTAGGAGVDAETALELVHGREAEMRARGLRLAGELLAVSADSLWVLGPNGGASSFPLSSLGDVRIRRHDFGGRQVLLWSLIGAGATSVALQSACGRVDDASCGGVVPGVAVGWAIVGGILGSILARSAHQDLPPLDSALRRYVRFPQGLPEGFERAVRPPAADSAPGPRRSR